MPDKPCYYNDAQIYIDEYDKNIIINDLKTPDISYFKKVIKDCRSDKLILPVLIRIFQKNLDQNTISIYLSLILKSRKHGEYNQIK